MFYAQALLVGDRPFERLAEMEWVQLGFWKLSDKSTMFHPTWYTNLYLNWLLSFPAL